MSPIRRISHFDDGIIDEVLYEPAGPRHAVPMISRGSLMLWPAASQCADCGRTPGLDPCCMTGEDDRDERVTEQEHARAYAVHAERTAAWEHVRAEQQREHDRLDDAPEDDAREWDDYWTGRAEDWMGL